MQALIEMLSMIACWLHLVIAYRRRPLTGLYGPARDGKSADGGTSVGLRAYIRPLGGPS